MKDVLQLARTHVVTAFRERVTLFWFLIFPLFLLTILTLIFGQLGQEATIHFQIALINEDHAAGPESFSALIESTFVRLSAPQEDSDMPLFDLHQAPQGESASFLETELSELRRGDRAAILVIPQGFHTSVRSSFGGESSGHTLELYMTDASVTSETAAGIIEQILSGINREILIRGNAYHTEQAVEIKTEWLGQQDGKGVSYVDFILPAIILMGFFTNGLFGVPGTLLFNRDRKVLHRYWVTPVTVPRYLTGFALGHLALCVLQFALLYTLGRFAFQANVSFSNPQTILLLLLSAITFMAFGLFIAAIAKTANSGMAVANILNMPMMFLSGMFFPVAGLPTFIRIIVYANPVSYLLEGLRKSVGVQTGTLMPVQLTYLVPLAWILVSAMVASRRLRWDVDP